MYKIVFVCSGNMCRSPFAETVLKQMLEKRFVYNVEVISVGTLNLQNCAYDENMVTIAKELGYEMTGTSKYMCHEAVYDADVILAMSPHHRDKLTQLVPYANWDRIKLFSHYCLDEDVDVPDPHYQTEAVYRKAADVIIKGCDALANRIEKMAPIVINDLGGRIIDLSAVPAPLKRLKPEPKKSNDNFYLPLGLPNATDGETQSKIREGLRKMIETLRAERIQTRPDIKIIDTPGLGTPTQKNYDDEQEE